MRPNQIGILCSILVIGAGTAVAQEAWTFPNGAKAALSLTYDDALDSQLDTALPALDQYGFKATFYVTIDRPGFSNRVPEWRAVAVAGHELGNHTLHHPCRGSQPGREWVVPEADLDLYTVERMRREVVMTNLFLEQVDGETERTYAYPCGEVLAGGESYVEAIAPHVVAARGVITSQDWIDRGEIDFYRTATYGPSEVSGDDLIAYAKEVLKSGGVGSFTFHGIGAEYLSVSEEAHTELLAWLDEHRDEIWVDTVKAVTLHLKKKETENK